MNPIFQCMNSIQKLCAIRRKSLFRKPFKSGSTGAIFFKSHKQTHALHISASMGGTYYSAYYS
jgi:hypothetical protein